MKKLLALAALMLVASSATTRAVHIHAHSKDAAIISGLAVLGSLVAHLNIEFIVIIEKALEEKSCPFKLSGW